MLPNAVSSSAVPLLDPSPRPVSTAARALPPAAAVTASPAGDALSLAGLAACVEDARATALSRAGGPPDPVAFAALRARLAAASAQLPEPYRRAVAEPLLAALDELGPRGFARLLADDPAREGAARLLLDVAQAVLQRGEGHEARATAAFQEVVSDLYAGFLSAEDRRGVKPPDRGVLPPLVRWGSAADGPYTWPVTDTAVFGVGAAIVSLPAANASGGVLAWAALAHETAGHDLLAADTGLQEELSRAVRDELRAAQLAPALADYWAERIDESASDVLGVLNMGPAAAVGLVGYFRALNGAWGGAAGLRNVGRSDDPHPADIARAYLAAETVRLLSFEGAGRWADRLVAEADRDLGRIRLGDVGVTAGVAKASAAAVARAIVRTKLRALEGHALGEIQDWRDRDEAVRDLGRIRLGDVAVTAGVAKASAAAVARAIVRTKLRALEGHALGEIQDWRDRDEAVVAALRRGMREGGGGAGRYAAGAFAAHAVAAAVYEAVAGAQPPAEALDGMVGVLAAMHARNPAWHSRRAAVA